jgi:hypothetical protein
VELAEKKRRPVGVVSLDNEWLLWLLPAARDCVVKSIVTEGAQAPATTCCPRVMVTKEDAWETPKLNAELVL